MVKVGETRESVKGILVRLSPEDGERLKYYPALLKAAKAVSEAWESNELSPEHTALIFNLMGSLKAVIGAAEARTDA